MDTVSVRANERTECRVVDIPIDVARAVLPALMTRALDRPTEHRGADDLVCEARTFVGSGHRLEATLEPEVDGRTRITICARALLSIPVLVLMIAITLATMGLALFSLLLLLPTIRKAEEKRAATIAAIFEGLAEARQAPAGGFRVSPHASFVAALEDETSDDHERSGGERDPRARCTLEG